METKGRLEKVDLRSHDFRVRDDVGRAVDLKHVVDDVDAAQLVGQWVSAIGDGILASGRLVALAHVSIALVGDPARGLENDEVLTLGQILAMAPGPSLDGGLDLTDDEFAAFLEAARGSASCTLRWWTPTSSATSTSCATLLFPVPGSRLAVPGWRELLSGRRVLISFQTRAEALAGALAQQ